MRDNPTAWIKNNWATSPRTQRVAHKSFGGIVVSESFTQIHIFIHTHRPLMKSVVFPGCSQGQQAHIHTRRQWHQMHAKVDVSFGQVTELGLMSAIWPLGYVAIKRCGVWFRWWSSGPFESTPLKLMFRISSLLSGGIVRKFNLQLMYIKSNF